MTNEAQFIIGIRWVSILSGLAFIDISEMEKLGSSSYSGIKIISIDILGTNY